MRRSTSSAQRTSVENGLPVSSLLGLSQRFEWASAHFWVTGKQRCAYLYLQGWQCREQGDRAAALRAFQELLIRGRQAGHQGWIGAAEAAIADASGLLTLDALPEVGADAVVALPEGQTAERCRRAVLLQAKGYGAAAIQVYQEVLVTTTRVERPLTSAFCLNGIGLSHLDQGQYGLAESRFRAAAAVLADIVAPVPSAIVHHNWGLTYYQRGYYRQAQTCFQTALQHWQASADSLGLALTLDYLGRIYAHQQECWLALGSFEAATDVLNNLAEHTDVRREAAALLVQMADLCEQTQHPELAIAYWLEALEIYQTFPPLASCVVIWQRLSRLHYQAGQVAIARHYAQCIVATVTI